MSGLHHKQEGNKHYLSAKPELAPVIRQARLNTAIEHYTEALKLLPDLESQSSLHKNLGMSYKKLRLCFDEFSPEALQWAPIESLKYLKAAYELGQQANKPTIWLNQLYNELYDLVTSMVTKANQVQGGLLDKLNVIRPITGVIGKCGALYVVICLKEAEIILNEAIKQISEGNYKECLNYSAECYYPIQEAMRYSDQTQWIVEQAVDFENRVFLQRCIAESVQARKQAQDFKEQAVQGQESLNMDYLWSAIDLFRSSIELAKEKDLENEAVAYSALADIFYNILKQKDKARIYATKCMELADSQKPRDLSGKPWYQTANMIVEKIKEDETNARENDPEYQQKKAKMRVELSDEIKALEKEKNRGIVFFTIFVYKTHPPKKTDQQLLYTEEEMLNDSEKEKNAVKKALVHYHSDKQREYDFKWQVLSEEIYKTFSAKWNCYKGL